MHAVNGIKFAKVSIARGLSARRHVAGLQAWISQRRLRRRHLLALLALALLGIVVSAYLSGLSFGKEQAQAALGHRIADASGDPLSTLFARSPGARGGVVHLTKVEPLERVSDETHEHHPDSGFFPAGYYGLGDDMLASEPDTLSSGPSAPKDGDDFTGFGAPPFSSDEPGDIFVPGGSNGGGPSGPSGPSGPTGPGGGGSITPTSPVPEPATWISLIIGFLGVGIAARRIDRAARLQTTKV